MGFFYYHLQAGYTKQEKAIKTCVQMFYDYKAKCTQGLGLWL
jgi:hypothetical protein